jgi:hypothetical protein
MKPTRFKRCLSLTLATTIATSVALPASFAHASGVTGLQSDDPAILLIQAMKQQSPEQAKQLLAKAKLKLQSEKLPDESQKRLDALIFQAQETIEHRAPQRNKNERMSKDAPIGFTFDNKGQVVPATTAATKPATPAAPAAQSEVDELQKLMMDNPALRDSMRELGKGRVVRDAGTMQTTMAAPIAAQNKADLDFATALQTPNGLLAWMRSMNMVVTNAGELNQALREQYPDLSTDELADKIIADYTTYAAMAGAARQALKFVNAPVISQLGSHGGTWGEAAATLVLQVNMVVRLTDLYGLKLSEANQNTIFLGIFALTKVGAQYGVRAQMVQRAMDGFGTQLGKAVANRSPKQIIKLFKGLFTNAAAAKALAGSPVGEVVKDAVTDLARNEAALANPQAAAAAAAPPQETPPAAPAKKPRAPRKVGGFRGALASTWGFAKAVGNKVSTPVKVVASAVWSGAEARFFGYVAKRTLKAAQASHRRSLNQSLANALYSNEMGLGFTKLLILAMNIGPDVPVVGNPVKSNSDKVKFILNLTRSQKVCSPTDMARYQQLVKQGKATAFQQAKSYIGFGDEEYALLKYTCDSNLNASRYNRTIKEFATFQAIPQSLVLGLRLASYNNRLAMAEVALQLMYLDGDFDVEEEMPFFKGTVLKILGLDNTDGISYFTKMDGFIHQHGGLEKNRTSPTGFSIRNTVTENPYDLSVGYMISGGPDAPGRAANIAGGVAK